MLAIKRATNVSLNAELLEAAKDHNVNISKACERGLADEVAAARRARWLHENAEAMEGWNDYVEKHGLPLAKYRQF